METKKQYTCTSIATQPRHATLMMFWIIAKAKKSINGRHGTTVSGFTIERRIENSQKRGGKEISDFGGVLNLTKTFLRVRSIQHEENSSHGQLTGLYGQNYLFALL